MIVMHNTKEKTTGQRAKGALELSVSAWAVIIFLILVTFFLFLIFASLGAESGPATNSIAYWFFDNVMSQLV